MDILYFCTPPLLDYSAEQIRDLKQHVNLHVVVCVSLHSPNHTIFKLKVKDFQKEIYTFDEVKDKIENIDLFEMYFDGCKSVHFVFFAPKFGLNILFTNLKLINLLNKINPDIIHFDDISGRLSVFVQFLWNRKIVLNVHDPAPHSGEQNWYAKIIRKLVYRKVSAVCTFSNFSKLLFEKIYQPTVPVANLRLIPYQSYLFLDHTIVDGIHKLTNEKVLLFFGRISPYKGIDELLHAFSKVLKQAPNTKLVVAGRGSYAYQIPENLKDSSSLIILNRFIHENEIKSLFDQADVLICPYRDATQSGVLMTASVFNIPVIVSNVGALPEYVQDGKNGYIYDILDEKGLENSILKFLNDHRSIDRNSTITDNFDGSENSQKLVALYTGLINQKCNSNN